MTISVTYNYNFRKVFQQNCLPTGMFPQIKSQFARLGFQFPETSQRSPNMFVAIIPSGYKGNLVPELNRRKIYQSEWQLGEIFTANEYQCK
jgi:hypothetical protein